MPAPVLATKLYIPPSRRRVVLRPRLVERLNEGLAAGHRLTLVSAPAGFGKTTLVGEWVAGCGRPVAWLSLDEGDSDPSRFLAYLVAALQTAAPRIGDGLLTVLRSPQAPPPTEATLTALLNDIATIPNDVVIVLDDYHVLDAKPVDDALAFLVEHLPPQVHLVIATREDPALPLARLRARGQLTELRGTDLRFTPSETAAFLNQVMDLDLSTDEVGALEGRTEGWIAGLQLAAISLQGREDAAGFIASFAGSHHFVLDYLVEEVLQRQSEPVQAFLLRTSILDRLCGPLCDAVLLDASAPGQETLEYLDRANLFIVPLDSERRWYRYHHLFADLLRRRLQSEVSSGAVDEDHLRATQWYEANGLEIEAFQHAAAGHDVERAERLIEGNGMPLHFRGALVPILRWLESLPTTLLDARPSLWVTYAQVLLSSGQNTGIEPKLQAAERALQDARTDDRTRDLVGRIASVRAFLVWGPHQTETIIAQSRRALEHLDPDNLPFRTAAALSLGHACVLLGDRSGARQALTEVTAISAASGNTIYEILGSIGLGYIEELDNRLGLAVETYRHAIELAAGLPFPFVCEAHLGLARVHYQWNDLDATRQHREQSLQLARQIADSDRLVACEVMLARLALARGDAAGAAAILAKADRATRQHDFVLQVPEVAAAQVLAFLRLGDVAAAAHVVRAHHLPLSQARVHLAQGDPSRALAVLEPYRRQMAEKAWADQQLLALVLLAVAFDAHRERDKAAELLDEALTLAEPGGFIRIFVDEGAPMARLLYEACSRWVHPGYVRQVLAAFPVPGTDEDASPTTPASGTHLAEPLSARELEVLPLIAEGLTNQEIAVRLYLSLHTVKAHARNIYAKLGVSSRTQAVATGRDLGLLSPGRRPDG
ncbi:MAG: LuxR family transcriptional regulator [Chloroflexota bacterium]|nr:MAG: LuxR family transcriptional regulator [Chloroflexota bacterium]